MNTVGTPLLWGGFAVVVAIMLAIDLLLQGRRGSHSMTMKQAAGWSILWVTLSLLFNARLLVVSGTNPGPGRR
ncbi:integral membrane protein TerC [Klebsiella variicola]|nr:integral membrane protein TerC [Klebsiella variicola]